MNKARQLISQKGLTEGRLMDDTGLSLPTIQHIMTADQWPNPKTYAGTIAKIAQVLGVSMDDLYSDNNNG